MSGAGEPATAGSTPAVRTIGQIQFTGNTRLSSQELSQAIGIRAGDVSSTEAIDRAMTKIVAAYRAIGRDLALMVDVTLTDTAHTRVDFFIDENGTGGNKGATPRSGARMGGVPPPPPAATRQ
jgi:outer membrane protein assembly factor BamA